MNISLTVKTQNMRSFNISNKDGFFRNEVKAATLERDDILLLTNTQVGNKSIMLTRKFNLEGYKLLNNSTYNNKKGVSIALKIAKNNKIMDAKTDKEERVFALKLMIDEEEITVVELYDINTNTDCHLVEIENILKDMEAHNGLIIGRDF